MDRGEGDVKYDGAEYHSVTFMLCWDWMDIIYIKLL
jgi:hypothetical protein